MFLHDGTNHRVYVYVKNLQGDIVAIANTAGTIVATYTYDAWGKIRASTDTDPLEIGHVNPLRYRGYYYDTETGFYYLNSRYYNPTWGRFINADGYITTGQGLQSYNMFSYCLDNAVIYYDPTGKITRWEKLGYSYDGSVQDFKRLEAGLPPIAYTNYINNIKNKKHLVVSVQPTVHGGFGVSGTLMGGFTYDTKTKESVSQGGWSIGGGTPSISAGVALTLSNVNSYSDLSGYLTTPLSVSIGPFSYSISISNANNNTYYSHTITISYGIPALSCNGEFGNIYNIIKWEVYDE